MPIIVPLRKQRPLCGLLWVWVQGQPRLQIKRPYLKKQKWKERKEWSTHIDTYTQTHTCTQMHMHVHFTWPLRSCVLKDTTHMSVTIYPISSWPCGSQLQTDCDGPKPSRYTGTLSPVMLRSGIPIPLLQTGCQEDTWATQRCCWYHTWPPFPARSTKVMTTDLPSGESGKESFLWLQVTRNWARRTTYHIPGLALSSELSIINGAERNGNPLSLPVQGQNHPSYRDKLSEFTVQVSVCDQSGTQT
jgi:hypothetical protein